VERKHGASARWHSNLAPSVLLFAYIPYDDVARKLNEWTVAKSKKKTPWPESASELYRPSYRRLSTKLVPNFADRGCHVGSMTDLYGRILGFLDRSRYFFFEVAPQLYSRG
jgi:hypothetical protein